MDRLSEERIVERLEAVAGWNRDGKWIERKYRFSSFMDAVAFVNEAAASAERLNHHPMIAIDYKMVTLRITTWHAGGLTELDFESAHAFDETYSRLEGG